MAKIFLVNVGANTADADKARSPIWPDGKFEFVSFPDATATGSYAQHINPYVSSPTLTTHADPDLVNLTYGDFCGNPRAAALLDVAPGDILLFWALLWRLQRFGSSVWDAQDRGWYIIAANRVAHVLRSGQEISSLPKIYRPRAARNAHVGAGRVEQRSPVRVFLGDKRFSVKFDRAVDLGVYRSRSLLQQIVRTTTGKRIEWRSSPRWNATNRFSITRQLRYSREESKRALDLALFINGLPIATFELKNSLTKQTAEDAEEQYKRDRDPRETLFQFGRCVVHFALDDTEVRMCTELKGSKGMAKDSWFLPFNQGWKKGAGNPPNPYGLKTDFLWRRILTPGGLTEILENYAQIVEAMNEKTGKKKRVQVFPRYHQLDVVRQLLADVAWYGAGKRYLVQHSAGSGKSNSIAWLAHQLIGLRKDGQDVFDSIIVITDRRVLDRQIRETIKGFAQVSSIIGAVKDGGSKGEQLAKFLRDGKKLIITTVQTFPSLLDSIGEEHRGKKFAIIIDEAHSGQGGRATSAVNKALGSGDEEEIIEDDEDRINKLIGDRIESRKLLSNASYFAFTATPKNKTLQMFGVPYRDGDEIKYRPFHSYTMKQAIQEGFILDVLKNYTPVDSYYRLAKTVEGDPEFDVKRARKKLRIYVESHSKAIRDKAEIMVDHFVEQVIGQQKIGGRARAMVVTGGIQRAIQYFFAFRDYLEEIKSPFRPIVAFSGEPEYKGEKVTESKLNGFPSNEIPDRIQEDPFRFLICADKFQTGYDEPLLHSMYVDNCVLRRLQATGGQVLAVDALYLRHVLAERPLFD